METGKESASSTNRTVKIIKSSLNEALNDLTFNFTGKLFQPLVFDRILKIYKEDISLPSVIEFDPTSSCNQNCIWCISKSLLNKGEIPFHSIKRLFNILKDINVDAIIFTGGGEPLMHSAMPEPLFIAKEMGFYVGLVTNGTLLNRFMHDLPGTVSWIRVSIDAASSRTYSMMHYNRAVESHDMLPMIMKSMETFAKNKGKTRLGFSFVIFWGNEQMPRYSNVDEIFIACSIAKKIGCDYFEIKPYTTNNNHILLSKDKISDIKKQYDVCKKLEDKYFRVYCSESLQEYLNNGLPFEIGHMRQDKHYEKCFISKLRTMISRDGIFLCPYFRGDTNKGHALEFNDLNFTLSDFLNILNMVSKKANPAVDCKFYCIRHRQNIIMESIINDSIQLTTDMKVKALKRCYDPFI